MTAKDDAEAVRDYMKALKEYNDKLDEYFPASEVVSGQEMKAGKVLTGEVLLELDKMANDVEEKRKAWMKSWG